MKLLLCLNPLIAAGIFVAGSVNAPPAFGQPVFGLTRDDVETAQIDTTERNIFGMPAAPIDQPLVTDRPDFTESTDAAHALNGGFTYLITNNLQLDWRIGMGLNEEAPDYFTGVGISWRF